MSAAERTIIKILLLLHLNYVMLDKEVDTINDLYGPYDLFYDNVRKCGPDNGVMNVTIELKKNNSESYLLFNITVLDNEPIMEVKVILYSIKNNVKTKVWSVVDKNPCKNFYFQSIFSSVTQNCILKPGTNANIKINLQLAAKNTLYGTSFLYGKYTTKGQVAGRKGRIISCIYIDMNFVKR